MQDAASTSTCLINRMHNVHAQVAQRNQVPLVLRPARRPGCVSGGLQLRAGGQPPPPLAPAGPQLLRERDMCCLQARQLHAPAPPVAERHCTGTPTSPSWSGQARPPVTSPGGGRQPARQGLWTPPRRCKARGGLTAPVTDASPGPEPERGWWRAPGRGGRPSRSHREGEEEQPQQ